MYTLGIHGGVNTSKDIRLATPNSWLHDAAAVLCKDGDVVAAGEEERFVRIKHVTYFPINAIEHCLTSEGIKLSDVDSIVLSSQDMNEFLKAVNNWQLGSRAWLAENDIVAYAARLLEDEFKDDVRERITISSHHMSHALGAIWQSGFSETLCVVLDGVGDEHTGAILSYRDKTVSVLRMISRPGPASLYLSGTQIIGYDLFDEYKVMGLAPYGDPGEFRSLIDATIHLEENGEFEITPPSREQLELHRQVFRSADGVLEQKHKNFAASLQVGAESILLHVLDHFRKATGHENLCLTGGFAQNCTANGKVLTANLFRRVFVQPAAYDAGCAIGAAIHGYLQRGGVLRPSVTKHSYWGTPVPNEDELLALLDRWSDVLEVKVQKDICQKAARLLANGEVLGWVQGRSEFGARALGNRSIIADPRPPENRERINSMIKKREAFRPFAPSVLNEHLHEYFDVASEVDSLPFMVFVATVRRSYQGTLGAVTHIDGSARVQSVSKATNPTYWALIDAFRTLTGVPIVLNTSFNNAFEPIVDSAADAVNCFLSSDLDGLVIGNCLINKKCGANKAAIIRELVPALGRRFSCARRVDLGQRLTCEIYDCYKNTYEAISDRVFDLVTTAIAERAPFKTFMHHLTENDVHSITDDLLELWTRRVIVCKPVR